MDLRNLPVIMSTKLPILVLSVLQDDAIKEAEQNDANGKDGNDDFDL